MRLTLASVSQPSAASGTATSQDLAPVGGSHALAEPVLLGTLTLLGLIGTNHSDTPPVSIFQRKPCQKARQPQRPNCPGRGRHTKYAVKKAAKAPMIAHNTLYRKPYPSVNLKFFCPSCPFFDPGRAPYKIEQRLPKKTESAIIN